VWVPEATATITGAGTPEEVQVLRATRSVLTTLGVPAEIGRWYSSDEDTPGARDVVVLSHAYWQRKFGGDGAVLSRALTIDGRPHEIVGVMPAAFRFDDEFDVILPLKVNRGRLSPIFRLNGVARMKPGVTLPQANADALRVLHVWFDKFKVRPEVRPRWVPAIASLKHDVIGDVGQTLWVLMVAVGVVLVMACANVANLLLVRGDARRREFAIRAALGARWTRVARQLLTESLTLAAIGGALGVLIAYGALRLLVSIEPANLPRLTEISIEPVVLLFALTISVLSGLLFGLFPIVKYARPRLEDVAGGRTQTMTRERQWSQQAMVAAQVALALVLLVSAGLMIRSFQALRDVDAGFSDPEHLQTVSVSIPASAVPEPERVTRMQQDILNRITALPGVTSAAFTTRVPMGADRSSAALSAEGRADDGRTPANRQVKIVSPGVFETMGTPLIAGRDFTWTDLEGTRDLAIVSDNLAREYWGSPEAALGKRIREYYANNPPWQEVVGVVGDVYDDGADQPAPATVYWPAQPRPNFVGGFQSRRVSFAIRTERAGTESLLNEVRQAVWSIDPSLPLADVRTVNEIYDQSLARTSFTLVMLAIAGAMALLLGIAGLYGVIAYAVSQRQREIGIRLAIGAHPREIRRLFLRRGLVLVAAGMTLGLAGAWAATRLMTSLLFGVSALDPLTFAAMPLVLATAALLASYLPARRAMAVDPVETLRVE
jgi:predicted permease